MAKKEILIGLAAAVILSILISPFASPCSDGLERVAENKGFIHKQQTRPVLLTYLSGYLWPGIKNERIATSLAGLAGTLIVFVLGIGAGFLLSKKNKQNAS